MRILKTVLLVVAALLVLVLLASSIAYRQFRGTPDWYATLRALTPAQLEAAAHSGEQKLIKAQNWAAELAARESARLHHAATGNGAGPAATQAAATTGPSTRSADATTLDFTEDELNAFFQKWIQSSGVTDSLSKHIESPVVLLQDGRVVLAGRLKELGGAVVSAHLEPKVLGDGEMQIRLVKVLGGNLPLPRPVWASQKDKLTSALTDKLPGWRKGATIDRQGIANVNAVSAGLADALLDILANRPMDAVIFLPVIGKGAVAARLTDVQVADKTVKLTVEPMTPAERTALLKQLKETGG